MLFLIRLATLFVIAAISAVLLKWTEPFALRLGSYPALAFGALAVVFIWLTRTQEVKGSRISPNPLREIFVGAFAAMLWLGAMLLFFYVAANTTGLSEAILDRDRRDIEKVASLLEADNNWEAASKVYLDALQIPHTGDFTRSLAERAVLMLTRAAQRPGAANAVSLLEKAIAVADEHKLPSDLPKAVLTRIRDKDSQAATEAELNSALAANKGLTGKNQELAAAASKRESAFRTHLETLRNRVEKDKLEALRHAAETRLAVAGTMSKVGRSLDLKAIRQHLAGEIDIAKKQGIDVRVAESVLRELDSAILALTPAALPIGSSVRLFRIHPSPMAGLLLLDVEVSDASRSPVLGLTRKDFIGKQGTQSLTVSYAPLSRSDTLNVAVVFDTSISTEGHAIRAARSAGIEFLKRVPAGTLLRVTSFNDRVKLLSDWSNDSARAVAACKSLSAEGGTALFAAVYEAIQALSLRPGGRELVVFSDGANMLPGPSKEEIISAAKRANVKVHFVALKSAGYDDTSVIEAMASGTGGETLLVINSSGLVEKFRELADKLNETGYRLAILDHDPNSPLELQIGGQNAVRLTIPSNPTRSN